MTVIADGVEPVANLEKKLFFEVNSTDAKLLSVNPACAERMTSGEKSRERRGLSAGKMVGRFVTRSARPVRKVIGDIKVIGGITATPEDLPRKTRDVPGTDESRFHRYFQDAAVVCLFSKRPAEI
jgi:hypothetical protein